MFSLESLSNQNFSLALLLCHSCLTGVALGSLVFGTRVLKETRSCYDPLFDLKLISTNIFSIPFSRVVSVRDFEGMFSHKYQILTKKPIE